MESWGATQAAAEVQSPWSGGSDGGAPALRSSAGSRCMSAGHPLFSRVRAPASSTRAARGVTGKERGRWRRPGGSQAPPVASLGQGARLLWEPGDTHSH